MALVFIFIDRLIRLCTPEVSSSQGVSRGVTEPVTAGWEHSPWDTAVTDGIGMPPAGTPALHLVQHMLDVNTCLGREETWPCCWSCSDGRKPWRIQHHPMILPLLPVFGSAVHPLSVLFSFWEIGSPYIALTCFYLAECEKLIKIVKNEGEEKL